MKPHSNVYKSHVPSTKDALLDHIHKVIRTIEPLYADRITGMLAGCVEEELIQLLRNQALLRERIRCSLLAITKVDGCGPKEAFGEHLFQKVAELEPIYCSQITGMLLELDSERLHQLLSDPGLLSQAISRAKEEWFKKAETSECHDNADEEVSEQVYGLVSRTYQKNAAKITGMLSELGSEKISHLLRHQNQLDKALEVCRHTLEDTAQWLPE